MVGTPLLFYYTLSAAALYESITSTQIHPAAMKASVALLLASPVSNGFIFGLKNKVGSLPC